MDDSGEAGGRRLVSLPPLSYGGLSNFVGLSPCGGWCGMLALAGFSILIG